MCGTRLLLLVPGEGCAQHVGGGGVRVSCRAVAVTIQRCAVIAGCDHTRVAPPAAAAARWRTPACCLLAAAHASACWWVRRPLLCCMCCWAVQLWERAAAPGEPASCVCVRVGDARRRVCCVAVWGKGAAGRGHGVLRSMSHKAGQFRRFRRTHTCDWSTHPAAACTQAHTVCASGLHSAVPTMRLQRGA
jgi:hypothetical protein